MLGKQQVVRHQNGAVNLPDPIFETGCSRTSSMRDTITKSMMYLVVYLVQRPLALVLDSHDHWRAVLTDNILHSLHAGVQTSRSVCTTRVVHRGCQAVSFAETEAAVVPHKCQSLQFIRRLYHPPLLGEQRGSCSTASTTQVTQGQYAL